VSKRDASFVATLILMVSGISKPAHEVFVINCYVVHLWLLCISIYTSS